LEGERTVYAGAGNIAAFLYYENDLLIGYSSLDAQGNKRPMTLLPQGSGKIETTWPDGTPAAQMNFDHGNAIGKRLVYHPNGKVAFETNFIQGGIDEGPTKTYSVDGTLLFQLNYDNNRPDGAERIYDNTGKLIGEIPFVKGQAEGEGQMLNPKTGKMMKLIYRSGLLISIN
jgi:antitoxin component YwqK of YwqJK toxin-antitoxin module